MKHLWTADRGAGDAEVESSEPSESVVHQLSTDLGVGDVVVVGDGVATGFEDFVDNLICRAPAARVDGAISIVDDHRDPSAREMQCDGTAEALTPSRDDGNAARE
jgi:hypothetical protein